MKLERNHVYTNGTVIMSRPNIMTQLFAPVISQQSHNCYSNTVRFGRLKGLSIFSSPGGTMKRLNNTNFIQFAAEEENFNSDHFVSTETVIPPLRIKTIFDPRENDENNNNSAKVLQSDKVPINEFSDSTMGFEKEFKDFNVFEVSLERNFDESRSFGIELIYLNDSTAVVVHRVVTGSIADKNGKIRKGDRLFAVNNKLTKIMWLTEMRKVFNTSRKVNLTFGRKKEREYYQNKSTSRYSMEVPIINHPAGLGLTIKLKKSADNECQNLFISNIYPGGPAEKSKRLKINDQILKIDNHDCFSLTKNEIKRLFNNCNSDKIVLTVLGNSKDDVE